MDAGEVWGKSVRGRLPPSPMTAAAAADVAAAEAAAAAVCSGGGVNARAVARSYIVTH